MIAFVVVVLAAAILVAYILIKRRAGKQLLAESLRLRILLVRLPQKQPEANQDLKEEINKSAQLFSLLSGRYGEDGSCLVGAGAAGAA